MSLSDKFCVNRYPLNQVHFPHYSTHPEHPHCPTQSSKILSFVLVISSGLIVSSTSYSISTQTNQPLKPMAA